MTAVQSDLYELGSLEGPQFSASELCHGFTAKWLGKAVEMGHNQGGTRKVG
jgi:hypothetical protein